MAALQSADGARAVHVALPNMITVQCEQDVMVVTERPVHGCPGYWTGAFVHADESSCHTVLFIYLLVDSILRRRPRVIVVAHKPYGMLVHVMKPIAHLAACRKGHGQGHAFMLTRMHIAQIPIYKLQGKLSMSMSKLSNDL